MGRIIVMRAGCGKCHVVLERLGAKRRDYVILCEVAAVSTSHGVCRSQGATTYRTGDNQPKPAASKVRDII